MLILLFAIMLNSAWSSDVMNGMRLKDFGNFPQEWKVVTVRYREDTGEMRMTYANKLAWQTLSAGKTNYPEGAMFAKIGVSTSVDSDFPSSRVPNDSKRFQFMVRNSKFKETNGWGYALFTSTGKKFAEDDKEAVMSCYSCHEIVAHRGDVFSEVAGFDLKSEPRTNRKSDFLKTSFRPVKFSTLPSHVKDQVGSLGEDVYEYHGPANNYVFAGTLDEMKPSLIAKAKEVNKPVFFISKRSVHFIGFGPGKMKCESDRRAIIQWQMNLVPKVPGGKADVQSFNKTEKCL